MFSLNNLLVWADNTYTLKNNHNLICLVGIVISYHLCIYNDNMLSFRKILMWAANDTCNGTDSTYFRVYIYLMAFQIM